MPMKILFQMSNEHYVFWLQALKTSWISIQFWPNCVQVKLLNKNLASKRNPYYTYHQWQKWDSLVLSMFLLRPVTALRKNGLT